MGETVIRHTGKSGRPESSSFFMQVNRSKGPDRFVINQTNKKISGCRQTISRPLRITFGKANKFHTITNR